MATFMAWSPSHRRQTSASDQNADGNIARTITTISSVSIPLLLNDHRLRLSVCCCGLGARLDLAAVDKVDWRIEDHLIASLESGVHCYPGAQIALYSHLAHKLLAETMLDASTLKEMLGKNF
jgi:hypothetical protein